MKMFENISLAFSSILANKMRALLTMLGIVIGIGSVIAIMTLGDSLTGSISSSMQSLGANNVTISLQSKKSEGRSYSMSYNSISAKDLISEAMLEDFQNTLGDQISAISLSDSVGSGQITQGRNYANFSLLGVSSGYYNANTITIKEGRLVSQHEEELEKKVAVVSDKLVDQLGLENPIGTQITVTANKHTGVYTIIGVYEYQANSMFSSSSSDKDISTDIYIPLSTSHQITNSKGVSSFTVITKTGIDPDEFTTKVTQFFDKYYSRNDNYGISVLSMESMLETLTSMLDTIELAIAAVAAISLLVGGIGVMNIMMVSITERTKEIGTRIAIGATRNEIRMQFIIEAMIICLIGGIIGIALGIGLGMIGASLIGTPVQASISTCLLAAAFSMTIGLFFGYYPANKAAGMNPIDALRYE